MYLNSIKNLKKFIKNNTFAVLKNRINLHQFNYSIFSYSNLMHFY